MSWSWNNIDWFATAAAALLLAAVSFASLTFQTLPPVSGQDTTERRARRERLQQRWLRTWLLAAIALAVCSALVFLAGSIHHDKYGIYGSDTAAWVQAIGSIGAILGAAGVAGWQAFAERAVIRRAERKARVDRVASMAAVANHLALRLGQLKAELPESPLAAANLMMALHGELTVVANRINSLFDIGLGSSVVSIWIAAEAQINGLQLTLEVGRSEVAAGQWDELAMAGVANAIEKTKASMIALSGACLGPMLKTAIGSEAV